MASHDTRKPRRITRPSNVTVYFSREAYARLCQAAEVEGRTRTTILERLIVSHLPAADVAKFGLTPRERRELDRTQGQAAPEAASAA